MAANSEAQSHAPADDHMERDDGLYASQHAIQDGGVVIPGSPADSRASRSKARAQLPMPTANDTARERGAMENGLPATGPPLSMPI